MAAMVLFFYMERTPAAFGSVSRGGEYHATTTAANAVYGASVAASTLLNTGVGTLGSVIITGAATGIVNLYDATKRASTMASSSILIASFPASTVAGTYTFDVNFFNGLYLSLPAGNMPTTTITWRE